MEVVVLVAAATVMMVVVVIRGFPSYEGKLVLGL